MEKEKTQLNKKVESVPQKEDIPLSKAEFDIRNTDRLLGLKESINDAQVLCKIKIVDGKETLTVRDIYTKKEVFYTENQSEINFLLEGVMVETE